ncbi:phospho-sugar mutase [Spirochaeta cellobiosiphila]|uniref:phospho-sugar mutase n=1 Tax=Spirochaeta cellobiosiphila TaxID=504483 RepID=UPI000429329C|nr:phospho-sugar mutase [Spirochaeta cellobiosiphila]
MDNQKIVELAQEYIAKENHPFFKKEVEELLKKEDYPELNERFYTSLSFGTGGLRGPIGGGSNRMNPLVVRKATQGLANYVNKAVPQSPSAVIAYDSRNYSDLFALEAALVLCSSGIKTYLFTELRPTPELSFALRELKASTGIVVTASHNPAAYNGYKVYWSDGAQIVPPHDKGIIEEVRNVSSLPKILTKEEAEEKGLLVWIDKELDDKYKAQLKKEVIRPELIKELGKDLKVAYTPLHGTGGTMVPSVLADLGIEVNMVPEQAEPNGDFPTVEFPNPEEASALKMVLDLGKKIGAHLVMGTDPDSDRLGIAIPEGEDYRLVTGNQLGALLADYVFSGIKERGDYPEHPAFVNTIVTSDFQRKIAESYGATHFQTLTGFKYIGEKIKQFEEKGDYQFLFGGEESYGYLVGTAVRDKDAVVAAMMTAEMTLYHKSQGKSLLDRLKELWSEHGYYKEILLTHTFQGQAGLEDRERLMETLRTKTPSTLGGIAIDKVKDYLTGETIMDGKALRNIDLPESNVLQFLLKDGSIVTARPSGTEPKIKFYGSCCTDISSTLEQAEAEVGKKIEAIQQDLKSFLP